MFDQKKLRCGIHIGDSFYCGVARIIWPFAWIELREDYISFGWSILRNSENFSLKYEDIIAIKKVHSVFFKTYQVIHNDKSISKFLLISTRHQYIWDVIFEELQK